MRASAIAFRVRATGQPSLVTVTVTGPTRELERVMTNAHCPPPCNRIIMRIPGVATVEVRKIGNVANAHGRGRLVTCDRCHSLCEVIEHG